MTNHEIDEIVVPASAGMERVRMEEIGGCWRWIRGQCVR